MLAFGGGGFSDRLILLASLGLDLARADVRAALLKLHRTGAIQLAPVPMSNVARTDLAHRDERPELLDESAIADGAATYHALLLWEPARDIGPSEALAAAERLPPADRAPIGRQFEPGSI